MFGEIRCRTAAERVLGTHKAEARRKVKNIYMFDGYDHEASLRLLMSCSNWKSGSLLDNITSALEIGADPNCGLADPRFNDYTPLIFLSMAAPFANGAQVAAAIKALIDAKADVYRTCGVMPTGRLGPLRFAARLQNKMGLQALLQHVDVGDTFQWAAGENAAEIMLAEMRRLFGEALSERIAELSHFSNNASVQMRLFASPMVGGTLTADGAKKLCCGKYEDGFIKLGEQADPNSTGLEGMTALMHIVRGGDSNLETLQALLKGKANPLQRDSSGATPLHLAASYCHVKIAKALMRAGAPPNAVDHAGFSPWMLVGEARNFHVNSHGQVVPNSEQEIAAAADQVHELLELLKPQNTPEDLLDKAEEDLEGLLELLDGEPCNSEVLERKFRLNESLFYSPRMVIKGAYEGRTPRQHLLLRLATLTVNLLQTPCLEGKPKALCKYFLEASIGPDANCKCAHVFRPWDIEDNRKFYRAELMTAVDEQLRRFASECAKLKKEIVRAAPREPEVQSPEASQATSEFPAGWGLAPGQEAPAAASEEAKERALQPESSQKASNPTSPVAASEYDAAGAACAKLLALEADIVQVPEEWCQQDPFWETVQERQLLRFDPFWAKGMCDGATTCLQLLRLGVPAEQDDQQAGAFLGKDSCAVSNLTQYSALRQVTHAPMSELVARGYVTYSNLCNQRFQDRLREIGARVAAEGFQVEPPETTVASKKLKRVLEKTAEAQREHCNLDWPGLSKDYVNHSHAFHILDTVRMSFICGGADDPVPEQVACSMRMLEEFESCTVKRDGICCLRKKSGFAPGIKAAGGYADVKLLIYADLGLHRTFDGSVIPLQIVGELQLILKSYMKVKKRMHLAYEVGRGSFDRHHHKKQST
eukprot:TRINITY_DN21035_c2_g1_i1.p1 TRINITY_DN21035_c2_g1~~TRINITY_DN21035_c2_g1_i1.p1  ORF type:complete len:890 (-),score=157.73 TRINITY_DN21035_c2_g1_i1:360-2993(-)